MSRYAYGASRAVVASRSRVAELEARLTAAHEQHKADIARIREDAARIRALETRLGRANTDRNASRARVAALTKALEAARTAKPEPAPAPAPIPRRFTPAQMRRRPGNPLGEARLMKAAAEAHRHGARKEAA